MTVKRPPKNAIKIQDQGPGFSPALSSLLSCTIKDGFCNKTSWSLLRDIYPYVSPHDRTQIDKVLTARNVAGEIAAHPAMPQMETFRLKKPLTQEEKFLGLLKVLQKYGGASSNNTFAMLERMIAMKNRMSRLSGNMNSPSAIFDIMDMMGNSPVSGEMKQMANMMNMMQSLGSLGNMGNMANMMGNMASGGGMDMGMMMELMKNMNMN